MATNQSTNQSTKQNPKNVQKMCTFVKNIPTFLGFLQDCELTGKLSSSSSKPKATIDESHVLFKKNIVMSGSRDKELEKKLKELGASLSSSVNSKTFVVITPDTDSKTGKVATARELKIQILSPEEFKNKFKL